MPIDRKNPDDVYDPNNNAYSQAISAAGTRQVFVAGTVPKNRDGELVGVDDMSRQVEKTLENIEHSLAAQDAAPSDVTRIRIFTTDMDRYLKEAYPDWPESRGRADVDTPSLVQEFFGDENMPASTLVEVNTFTDSFTGVADGEPTDADPQYLVEIDVTAVVDD